MVVVSTKITTGGQETILPGEGAPSNNADDRDEKVFLDHIPQLLSFYMTILGSY